MKIKQHNFSNYVYGLTQPSTRISIDFSEQREAYYTERILKFSKVLQNCLCVEKDDVEVEVSIGLNLRELFIRCIEIISEAAGDRRYTDVQSFTEAGNHYFLVPTLSPKLINSTTNFIVDALKKLEALDEVKLQNKLSDFEIRVKRLLPSGTNPINFIDAASRQKIPFKVFQSKFVIFGYGNGSTIFNSSITERESTIGVQLATSKVMTNRFLKMNGIPVARQAVITSFEDAKQFAHENGYPIVLKPTNQEQSRGVHASLVTENELKHAFDELEVNYKIMICENHIEGDVFRVNTIGGKVVRVVRRIPPTLVGDGISTIEKLLETFNDDPRRNDRNSSMTRVELNDDTLRAFSKQGVTPKTILDKDHMIRLNWVNSVSRGATSFDFLSQFHKDNIELCERISRIMRLDITGIDLISTDGAVSWKEGCLFVCEVNSMPQLGVSHMDIYDTIMKKRVKSQPKINITITKKHLRIDQIFDPSRKTVEIAVPAEDILRDGLPTQYFDHCFFEAGLSDDTVDKINSIIKSVPPNND